MSAERPDRGKTEPAAQAPAAVAGKRERIVVAICTYNRNGPLGELLAALLVCAERIREAASVGVVIVDDTAHGGAREIADAFAGRFDLGLTYRISGRRNISLARNLAVETAAPLGDWVAMTDDDCEPVADWLAALLGVADRTGADAVTGLMVRRVPPGSPRWIEEEPFLSLDTYAPDDAQVMTTAYTNNSLVSSAWLLAHPRLRFDPALGTIGGEDMAFFGAAHAAGLAIRFSAAGFVYENEPPSRATLRYQLRRFWWHGNSTYVTMTERGHRPARAFVHGAANFARALARPVARIGRGEKPQLRYAAASLLLASGTMAGLFGVRVRHR